MIDENGVTASKQAPDTEPNRATRWRLKTREVVFSRRPRIMGIVNVTPDSFSDGGRFFSAEEAIQHGLELAADGADILDVGGESTRPYSAAVDEGEELRRVVPVVQSLAEQCAVPVSIDTSKAKVAVEATAAGAEIINDVTGLEGDPGMLDAALGAQAGVCAMHMQGTPQMMQDAPTYDDVVQDILQYLMARRDALVDAGILLERICLDPGIGFGKTHQHNLTLLANCSLYHSLGCPLLVGHSRKGFIAHVLGDKSCDRTAATIAVSLHLALHGIQVLRVHDVLETAHALALFEACGGL